jgi:hypothetical protein
MYQEGERELAWIVPLWRWFAKFFLLDDFGIASLGQQVPVIYRQTSSVA